MNLDPYGAFLFLPDFPPGQNYIDRQNYFLKKNGIVILSKIGLDDM